MVGGGSASERDGAGALEHLSAREQRALARCRRALGRGRRVRGRIVASGAHGLLLDLRGVVGHVPVAEARDPNPPRVLWRPGDRQWEGWVVAVAGDLVHLAARRSGEDGGEGPLRWAEVLASGREGATVQLDDGSRAVVPWEELSWEPSLESRALEPGQPVEGRVIALTLDGPVLSPRAAVPSPWPAIALALTPGTDVTALVEARRNGLVRVRTDRPPRAVAIVPDDRLPPDTQVGDAVEATVARVNPHAASLELVEIRSRARAAPPAPKAATPEPPGPGRAASGSRS